MNEFTEKLISWLFETGALKVCPENKPFWYTSGTIGPYYINTHYLYGSEEKANNLLDIINIEKNNKMSCPETILKETMKNYEDERIYRELIDEMCFFIKQNIDISSVKYISGGERRDWFFSLPIAAMFDKPHITIYKDEEAVLMKCGSVREINNINRKKVLHIADLITEASSYERTWIPAVRKTGGVINWSLVVVDRKQGGEKLLKQKGIKSYSMININIELFERALSENLINTEQFEMLVKYIEDPERSMALFIKNNPEFMKNSLNGDKKTKQRAEVCIENNYYNVKDIL